MVDVYFSINCSFFKITSTITRSSKLQQSYNVDKTSHSGHRSLGHKNIHFLPVLHYLQLKCSHLNLIIPLVDGAVLAVTSGDELEFAPV